MFTYDTPTNLAYVDAEQHVIAMHVKFTDFSSPVVFIASPADAEDHGRELYNRAIAGDFGSIAAYVAPVAPEPIPQQPADIQTQIAAIEAQLAALKAQL